MRAAPIGFFFTDLWVPGPGDVCRTAGLALLAIKLLFHIGNFGWGF